MILWTLFFYLSSFLIEQLVAPGAASILTVAGIIFLLVDKKVRKFRFLGLVVISVIITLMLLHGESYYTQGIFPLLVAAGAITVIGKKYGLPEAICFSESFRYWIPEKFDPDITSMVYINDKPGDDIRQIFRKITKIGSISNPDAREFGTAVYLCEESVDSFNKFWQLRIKDL